MPQESASTYKWKNQPATIADLVATNTGASLIFAEGIPQSIKPPSWSQYGDGEMEECMRSFFLKHSGNIPQTPLDDIADCFDCIAFMNANEESRWLPVWMCGALYAVDCLEDPSECVIQWAESALKRCLAAGTIAVSMEAIDYFASRIGEPFAIDADLQSLIENHRRQIESA